MRVLAHVHKYPPKHNAGAEWYVHSVLRWLAERGHSVRVVSGGTARPYDFEGVPIVSQRETVAEHERADVVLTHLDSTRQAIRARRVAGRPLVHLVHNDRQLAFHNVQGHECSLAVFNSSWVGKRSDWGGLSMVLAPPVFAGDYRTGRGDALTLINLTEAKGAPLFYELAARMPERRFVGVLGCYGVQVLPERHLQNVEIWENRPDARAIYAQTRVLLMPSSYESWGRTAIEAAASGIPTIAHPTPGLRESLGSAGLFVHREKVERWERCIARLDEPDTYHQWSALAMQRSQDLDPTRGLEEFELRLEMVIAREGVRA